MPRNLKRLPFKRQLELRDALAYVDSYMNNRHVLYFKKGSVDFSIESFLRLFLYFLSIYKLVVAASAKMISMDTSEYVILKSQNDCFQCNGDIISFFETYDRLESLINSYLSSKSEFTKDLYLRQITPLCSSLVPIFNILSEYIGSISNTYIYRNVTVNNRVLSIIDRKLSFANKIIISRIHFHIANFFNLYYSVFSKYYGISNNVYGFIKGRSCVDNAKYHLQNKPQAIINTDVNKFFNNCTIIKTIQNKIFLNTLSCFEVKPELINSFNVGIISLLFYATHNSVFPTGSSFTPVLSNLLFINIDIAINEYIQSLMKEYRDAGLVIKYSRYADDITLSSNIQKINNHNVLDIKTLHKIESILNFYGFYIKYSKSKIYGKGDAKIVNGIYLDLENNRLSVGSDRKFDLKQQKRLNPELKDNSSYLGYMSYLKSVSVEQHNYIME